MVRSYFNLMINCTEYLSVGFQMLRDVKVTLDEKKNNVEQKLVWKTSVVCNTHGIGFKRFVRWLYVCIYSYTVCVHVFARSEQWVSNNPRWFFSATASWGGCSFGPAGHHSESDLHLIPLTYTQELHPHLGCAVWQYIPWHLSAIRYLTVYTYIVCVYILFKNIL